MANRAYLVGSANEVPAGPFGDGINYDPDTEILAASSCLIPALWLCAFREENLTYVEIEDNSIPTLVTPVPLAKERVASRREMLDRALPDYTEQLNDWESLVNSLEFQYLKIDGTEVWALDPDSFSEQLPAAIRWFHSVAEQDFRGLQAIAEISYDSATKSITVADSVRHNLHGYKWVRDVPWDDDAPAETEVVHKLSFEQKEENWRTTVAMIVENIGLSDHACGVSGCDAKALNGLDCCPQHEFKSAQECKWAGCQRNALKNSVFCPGHSQ